MRYFIVGASGMVGALLRYVIGIWFSTPIATVSINLVGSFVLAYVTTYIFQRENVHPYLPLAIGTGLIGSFTTFSTCNVELLQMLQNEKWLFAFTYMFISIVGGFLFALLGLVVGRRCRA